MYLITDEENKTWRGNQWDVNITHTEDNDNYHFFAYTNPLTALFMYPAYEGDINNPRLWKGKGEERSRDEGIRSSYGKFTTSEKLEVTFPTEEQSMIFGFVNALAVAHNKTFNAWALKYLKKEDESLESANKMLDEIMFDDKCSCAYALVAGIEKKDFHRYAAYSSHRAWHDSLDQRLSLDLEQAAQVALTLPLEDVVQILS